MASGPDGRPPREHPVQLGADLVLEAGDLDRLPVHQRAIAGRRDLGGRHQAVLARAERGDRDPGAVQLGLDGDGQHAERTPGHGRRVLGLRLARTAEEQPEPEDEAPPTHTAEQELRVREHAAEEEPLLPLDEADRRPPEHPAEEEPEDLPVGLRDEGGEVVAIADHMTDEPLDLGDDEDDEGVEDEAGSEDGGEADEGDGETEEARDHLDEILTGVANDLQFGSRDGGQDGDGGDGGDGVDGDDSDDEDD